MRTSTSRIAVRKHPPRIAIVAFGIAMSVVIAAGCGGRRGSAPGESTATTSEPWSGRGGGSDAHSDAGAASTLVIAPISLEERTETCGAREVEDFFEVVNTGSAPIKLSDISIKFWAFDTTGRPMIAHVRHSGCVARPDGDADCDHDDAVEQNEHDRRPDPDDRARPHRVRRVRATAEEFVPACGPEPTQQANWEITIADKDDDVLPPGATWTHIGVALDLKEHVTFSPGAADWYSPCVPSTGYTTSNNFGVYFRGDLVFSNGIAAPNCRAPHGSQQLSGYITGPLAAAPLVGPVPPSTQFSLAISLPVQVPTNFPTLADFAHEVSDPTSSRYRQFLTSEQYAGYYQPTQGSYRALVSFVQSYGTTVTRTAPDNEILDVIGTASQIEQMLFANLNIYTRPDGTPFFAPDRQPSLALSTPILSVAGLQNYSVPVPGSGPTGPAQDLFGADFRNAYLAPCEAAYDGTGEAIGILSFQTFNPSDIDTYCSEAGIRNPSITTVTYSAPLAGSPPENQSEAPLDIELAHAMAPGAKIIVYVAPHSAISYGPFGGINFYDDMLHDMAHPPSGVPLRPYQNSSSYVNGDTDEDTGQELSAIAAMGGSFFQSTGDGGAFTANPLDLRAFYGVTLVGGTVLDAFGGVQMPPQETAWPGSGGGFFGPPALEASGSFGSFGMSPASTMAVDIPSYQTPVAGFNGASAIYRNFPDVSFVARNIADIYSRRGSSVFPTDQTQGGTSASTPLWAGFMALVNQAAHSAGVPPVGFANPVLYGIGPSGSLYSACFNDITSGNNPPKPGQPGAGPQDPYFPAPAKGFSAGPGYDLVTGLGSPTCTLIAQLASPTPLVPVCPNGPVCDGECCAGTNCSNTGCNRSRPATR